MDIFRQHEVFEIEVLEKMNSAKMLDSLIFGGGSMLRLCHELNRYSVDLVRITGCPISKATED